MCFSATSSASFFWGGVPGTSRCDAVNGCVEELLSSTRYVWFGAVKPIN